MATISLCQGKLKGGKAISDSGTLYYEFLGVPYAKPPVGDLRFKSPQPLEPSEVERDATSISPQHICCQVELTTENLTGSEDCLYLNVYTPKLPDSNTKLLPVMVYIHGGGFIYGNGIIKEELSPDYLIDHDVIVVTFNYRLGVLGFLSLDIPEAAGNMGLKDQIFVLKWVQENIEKFGGDRKNVSLIGLSAGSASVECHILSPQSKGLFHKAILQSGSSLNHWAFNYNPKQAVMNLLKKTGYTGPMDNDRKIYEYLMTTPIDHLLQASSAMVSEIKNKLNFIFVPTIEKSYGNKDAVITESPYTILKKGKINKVPVIKGFCNREGSICCDLFHPESISDIIENKNFVDRFSYDIIERNRTYINLQLLKAYSENVKSNEDKVEMALDFYGDFDFVAGIWLSGQIMASHGVPVYFYEFSYDGHMNYVKKIFGLTRKGAVHGDDFTYLFKNQSSQFCEGKDGEVRRNVCLLLTNFAKTSIPDTGLSVEWPTYQEKSPAYLNIDENLTVKYDYEPAKMALFREIYEKMII